MTKTTHFGFQTIPTSEKTEKVGAVFHSVAKRYDIMNDLMSFGLHHLWKRMAIARLDLKVGQCVLDLAGGTGDLTRGIWKKVCPQEMLSSGNAENVGKVVLADINASMLAEGKKRLLNRGIAKGVGYLQGNAESLPFLTGSFDRAIIGFGLRNVTDKEKALSELLRVLKPEGRLVILEFSHPTSSPASSPASTSPSSSSSSSSTSSSFSSPSSSSSLLSKLYDHYSFKILPILGKIICNDSQSYQYLAESIRMHPNQETLKQMMETVGFVQCEYQNIHQGIVAIHTGFKN